MPVSSNTNNPITDAEKIRKLPWLILHSSANSVWATLTVFGSVFILFLDRLGLPKGKIGLILSFFPFCGIIALFVAPRIARFGLKRAFILFWGARKFVAALLLLTPWVLARYGPQNAFYFVALCILVFAVCRSLGETAFYPWAQEIVPNNVRGRFAAVNNIAAGVASALSVWLAAYYLKTHQGLSSFMALMGIGFVFGLLCIWAAFFIPRDTQASQSEGKHLRGMLETLSDRRFARYLCGIACVLFAGGAAGFLPLYMKEKLGVSESNIVLITIASLAATIATSYVWGWIADRYGSRAILLLSLGAVAATYALWVLAPKHSVWSLWVAVTITFISGMFSTGYGMADQRMLYVTVIPEEKKTSYTAVYYAWIGIIGGLAPLIMGSLLDIAKPLSARMSFVAVDGYTPLLVTGAVVSAVGVLVLRSVPSESDLSPLAFVSLLGRGNVLAAADSLVKHGRARDEDDRVEAAERMGAAKSPLTTNELLSALADPSESVRHEALIAAAHSAGPEASVVAAVLNVADIDEPDLCMEAIWALGRMGAVDAAPRLRAWIASTDPLIRSAAARSLGVLRDTDSLSELSRVFREDTDPHVRSACVSALGTLGASEFTSEFLGYLRDCDARYRRGVALAIARLSACEAVFSRLSRGASGDRVAEMAAETLAARHALTRSGAAPDILDGLHETAYAFEKGDPRSGIALLAKVCILPPLSEEPCSALLRECSSRMTEYEQARLEYVYLALGCLAKAG